MPRWEDDDFVDMLISNWNSNIEDNNYNIQHYLLPNGDVAMIREYYVANNLRREIWLDNRLIDSQIVYNNYDLHTCRPNDLKVFKPIEDEKPKEYKELNNSRRKIFVMKEED